MPLAVRRALARRGLLGLVALLVVAVAATGGTAAGTFVATTTASARAALGGPDPAGLVVRTRLAADPTAQEDRFRATVDDLFAGAPVQVSRVESTADGDTPFVTWTLVPDVGVLQPDDLAGLVAGSIGLRDTLRRDDAVAVRGVTVTGDLGERAAVEHAALGAARAVVTVPALLLLLLSLVALTQAGRVLAGAREPEVELLVARGASPRRLVAGAAVEAVVVGGAAAVAGVALAAALLTGRGPGTPGPVAAAGAVTAVAAVVVLTAVAAAQARTVAARGPADRSGRLRQAATAGTVVAVGVVAVLGLLRLRTLGSPAVTGPDGVTGDPLAAAGPAVALVALGTVVLAVLGPATRAWAALAARGRGLTGALVARRTARGLRLAVVPVVLLVLATGSAVLAGAYGGTEQAARQAAAVLAVGTDVRATVPGGATVDPSAPPPDTSRFAGLPGAAAAAPALTGAATVQGAEVGATALPADLVPAVVVAPGAGALAASLRGSDVFGGAPVLPDDATALVLELSGTAAPVPTGAPRAPTGPGAQDGPDVAVTLWLGAPDGTLTALDAGTATPGPRTTRVTLTVAGTDIAPGARLAAVGLDVAAVTTPTRLDLAVRSLTARTPAGDVPVDLTTGWTSVGTVPADGPDDGTAGEPRLAATLAPTAPTWARLVAVAPGQDGGAPDPVPAVVSAAAADRWAAAPGDTVEITWAGTPVRLEVVGTADAIPGQRQAVGVLADLGALDAALLRTTPRLPRPAEVWVAATDPAAVPALATAVGAEAHRQGDDPGTVTVTTTADALGADAGSPVARVFLVVAAGAVAVALLGLAAVAVTTTAGRRGDVVVLRALGVAPRAQGAARALELGVVALLGTAAGLAAGAGVAALAVPGLVAGVVPGGGGPVVLLAGPVLGAVGAAVAGAVAVAAGVAAVVAAQARDTEHRPEVR
ncbi:hypothetical protein ATJ88_1134 [Isoptericola jiangsuensis]|uniref:FtsX-like permease family protein n=1 Tax=Isoptericola jiangsuensis TaxID=548579 RepID=A0A2A9EW14_9MICO|nr:hypothetical protein [Isoptericola jiangsuensis]PFG42472.1 hypothetical protein ATJ88_1134 [Isoptericola jiangsuensis]